MAVLEFTLYKYIVENGRIVGTDGVVTLPVEDTNGDGLLSQRELSAYFETRAQGHLLGSNGAEGRDALFTVGTTGSVGKDYLLVSAKPLAIGTDVRSLNLRQNFPPFDPSIDGAPCFAAQTMIETEDGPVAAGDLRVGMRVRTRDGGFQPIRWVGKRYLSAAHLAAQPKLRPIRVAADSLSLGLPHVDLLVSPQHRLLVRSRIAQRMFGAAEVLVAAFQLCAVDGIDVAEDVEDVTYVHFLLDEHQIVYAEGAEAESLYPGEEAMRSVGPAARDEILTLFPELAEGAVPAAARQMVAGRMARQLAERHFRNAQPLLGGAVLP